MVNFQILFSELKEGHCREKRGKFMGVEMVLIDGKELTGFDVTRSIQNFRFADAPVSIRFIEQTDIIGGGAGHKDHLDRETQSTQTPHG
ncbi:hypothetical protein HID58_057792 [Brassica napus]|uniref:Uncharacterized protein n=1 Tax=Brassica napus TaxID=3708 RepID=A0ABQ7XFJ5_BRANA|nr:hypothetical protein HID58_057792 [Brassica napus]